MKIHNNFIIDKYCPSVGFYFILITNGLKRQGLFFFNSDFFPSFQRSALECKIRHSASSKRVQSVPESITAETVGTR